MLRKPLLLILLTIAGIAVFTAFAPIEKTLGEKARFVYLHGAWVWAAQVTFLAAAAAGLAGLLTRQEGLHGWSRALGRVGLLAWIGFLPQSMYLMQANWNGLFLDEPRFREPLNYAVVGLLLQVGLAFLPLWWTSLGNLVYGLVLVIGTRQVENVLHPDSPILTSTSLSIQVFFGILLFLLVALMYQAARLWKQAANPAGRAAAQPSGPLTPPPN